MPIRDKAAHNAYCREWAARNKEKRRQTARLWREKHGERFDATRRAYRAKNREKLKAIKEKWERENPDRVAAARALSKLRRERLQLAANLKRNYDFTLEQFEAMREAQANRCAICGTTQGNSKGHRLYVDHDHSTGIVRGLLCGRCNSAIGYFDEDVKRLRRAAVYIEAGRREARLVDAGGLQPILGLISETPRKARRDQGVWVGAQVSVSAGDSGRSGAVQGAQT